jgi:hypothetical protein
MNISSVDFWSFVLAFDFILAYCALMNALAGEKHLLGNNILEHIQVFRHLFRTR